MALVDVAEGSRNGERGDRPTTTRRMDIACSGCAKSKTKCDLWHPCSRCRAKGSTCISRQPRRGKAARASGFTTSATTYIPATADQRGSQIDITTCSVNHDSQPIHTQSDQNTTTSLSLAGTIFVNSLDEQSTSANLAMVPPSEPLLEIHSIYDQQPVVDSTHLTYTSTNATEYSTSSFATKPVASAGASTRLTDMGVEFPQSNGPLQPLSTVRSEPEACQSTVNAQLGAVANNQASGEFDMRSPSPMNIDGWDTTIFAIATPLNEPQHSMEPPQLDGRIDVVHSLAAGSGLPHNRPTSEPLDHQASQQDVDEDEATWAPDWEYWTICQCTSFPQRPPPDRQKLVLTNLDHNFLRPGAWTAIDEDWRERNFNPHELFTNVPLSDGTREWLLVISQRFMRLAVDIHGLALDSPSPVSFDHQDPSLLGGYIRLPPTKALHNYLEIVLRNYEPFYPLLPARMLEPNHLTSMALGRGPSLLLCFMIAFGSMIDPALKARRFSTAMTEICRHSVHDAVEKDSHDLRNPFLYYSALMYIIKGAFSGDKAHMNICVAHRHLYLRSMQHAGVFTKRASPNSNQPPLEASLALAWKAWIERESISRLAHCWILAEQEISLLYGLQPRVNMSEVEATLPADESLWNAPNADAWQRVLCAEDESADWVTVLNKQPNHSLRSLFQSFVDEQLDSSYQPRLLHMRLLLYPLHVLVAHLSQVLDYGCDNNHRPFSSPTTGVSSMLHSEEIQHLLLQWMVLFRRISGEGERFRAMSTTTLVVYHLISLNLYTSFQEIERFARGLSLSAVGDVSDRWIRAREDTLVHCGQIIRQFNEMKDELRPIWSAAAIYRATLTLWYFSITNISRNPSQMNRIPTSNTAISLNSVSMDDDAVKDYLRFGRDEPFLHARDGTRVTLHMPEAVLALGIEMINHGPLTTAFSIGVKRRLEVMLQAWEQQQ